MCALCAPGFLLEEFSGPESLLPRARGLRLARFWPTEMVRDMRGMRAKLRGLVDVCIGWRPRVGTALAGEAFAADGAHRQELLQGGGLGCQRAAHLTRTR